MYDPDPEDKRFLLRVGRTQDIELDIAVRKHAIYGLGMHSLMYLIPLTVHISC